MHWGSFCQLVLKRPKLCGHVKFYILLQGRFQSVLNGVAHGTLQCLIRNKDKCLNLYQYYIKTLGVIVQS